MLCNINYLLFPQIRTSCCSLHWQGKKGMPKNEEKSPQEAEGHRCRRWEGAGGRASGRAWCSRTLQSPVSSTGRPQQGTWRGTWRWTVGEGQGSWRSRIWWWWTQCRPTWCPGSLRLHSPIFLSSVLGCPWQSFLAVEKSEEGEVRLVNGSLSWRVKIWNYEVARG